jgi:hypothetical protein
LVIVPGFGVDVKEDVLAERGAAGVELSGSESSKGEL